MTEDRLRALEEWARCEGRDAQTARVVLELVAEVRRQRAAGDARP